MADPTRYTVGYDFSDYQTTHSADPLPGSRVDAELANIKTAMDSNRAAIMDVRRSDGALKNGVVTPDSLSSSLTIGFTNRGAWAEGVEYGGGDGVTYNEGFYSARSAHTSTSGNGPSEGADNDTWLFLFTVGAISLTDGSVTPAKLDLSGLAGKSVPVDGDLLVLVDSEDNDAPKGFSWGDARAAFRPAPLNKSANYTLAETDRDVAVIGTGTWTLALLAAATAGAGFAFWVKNAGTGIITIDPDSSETIDGATTIRLYRGESCHVFCDGTTWTTIGRSSGRVLVDAQTAAAATTLDFLQGINSDFTRYELDLDDVYGSVTGYDVRLRLSPDGGSNWYGTVNPPYVYLVTTKTVLESDGSTTNTVAGSNAAYSLYGGVTFNTVGFPSFARLTFSNLARNDNRKYMSFEGHGSQYQIAWERHGTGALQTPTNIGINGIRLFPSSGNFSLTGRLYGIR